MKHIIVFDIKNCQEDYSRVIEGIDCLKDPEWLRENEIKSILKIMPEKMMSRCEIAHNVSAIKYFECPKGIIQKNSNNKGMIEKSKIYENYYYYLREFTELSTEDEKNNILRNLSSIFYVENQKLCKAQIPHTLIAKLQRKQKSSLIGYINDVECNNVYYHIRIKVSNKYLYNLQYLALLLRHNQDLVNAGRISVILLNDEMPMNHFPFCDPNNSDEIDKLDSFHGLCSSYLRLLSKKYTGIIYAPKYERTRTSPEPNLAPMNFKNISTGNKYFPIIHITNDIYKRLFIHNDKEKLNNTEKVLSTLISKEDLWREGVNGQNKYALFQTGRLRFYNSNEENPDNAILAYIAETAWKKLYSCIEKMEEDELPVVKKTIIERFTEEQNNWLTFAIFAFLYAADANKEWGRRCSNIIRIDRAYKVAREMSMGLQQLMQNSIQHSQYKSCVFTFYVDDENRLCIFVVDINTDQTIIDTFKGRLCSEIEVYKDFENSISYSASIRDGHRALIECDDIRISHFFNVFKENKEHDHDGVKEAWKVFRQSDSTAHIGLLLFYQAVQHCHADFLVQSEDKFELENNENIFIRIDSDKIKNKSESLSIIGKESDLFTVNARIVPGTQYLVSVSLDDWSNDYPASGASITESNFIEDYHAFADFIDTELITFEPSDINIIIESVEKFDITNPEDKFIVQLSWEKFWSDQFKEVQKNKKDKAIYYWNVTENSSLYLKDANNCEVFIKGLFGSLNNCNKDDSIYFAITKLEPCFLEMLRNVSVSFACKRFKNNLQLYFIDKNNYYFAQFLGGSFLQVVLNAVQLSIEHGSNLFRPGDSVSARHIAVLTDDIGTDDNKNDKPIAVVPFDVLIPNDESSDLTIFEAKMLKIVEQKIDAADDHGYKLVDTHTRLGSKVHIRAFYEMSFLFYRTIVANRIAFKVLRRYSKKLRNLIDNETLLVKPMMFYSYASYSKAILTSLVETTKYYIEIIINKICADRKIDEDIKNEAILNAKNQVAFASYQYNLQSETSRDTIQLYFGYSDHYSGAKFSRSCEKHFNGRKRMNISENINLVLVVPISSTLTTYEKMLERLNDYIDEKGNSGRFVLSDSFTAFWVSDNAGITVREKLFPSDIEKEYWVNADMSKRVISVRTEGSKGLHHMKDNPEINYFMRVKTVWELPLKCLLCFPDEKCLINEVPLVETDLTSTVPSQQIRSEIPSEYRELRRSVERKRKDIHIGVELTDVNEYAGGNNSRIMMLKECVFYGHIKRGKNHYQYYINTQDYFYKDEVKKEIKRWLIGLREKNNKEFPNHNPKLKIIFSPEHNTNVGFAQYVNTYYFGGTAEVISINEDKEFRSNFICEHAVLRQTIERLHIQKDIFTDENPVEFYFVDDSVNSGETIKKANSFLRSLIPEKYVNLYQPILFKKCFILIDRLSNASKSPLVSSGSELDFHAFVHIDISHMRRQGDSCVGCKLQAESKRLFKRSSSGITASYWARKYERNRAVHFDDTDSMSKLQDGNNAYERLVLSHIAQNYIFNDGIITRQRGEYYDSILYLFENILSLPTKKNNKNVIESNFYFHDLLLDVFNYNLCKSEEKKNYEQNLNEKNYNKSKLVICELLIKLLARPFFSFDFSFRLQIQSFLLILSECYLGIKSDGQIYSLLSNVHTHKSKVDDISNAFFCAIGDDNYKGFLKVNNRIKRTVNIADKLINLICSDKETMLSFFKDVLFEALTDMRSTYLLRKSVIDRVEDLLNNQFVSIDKKYLCKKSCLLDNKKCHAKNMKECFWISYITHIQRIIDCNADETKLLWFYYLVLSGKEISIDTDLDKLVIDDNTVTRFSKFSGIGFDMMLLTAPLEYDTINESMIKHNQETYHLSNYYMQRKWAGLLSRENDCAEKWMHFLSGKLYDNNVSQNETLISKRYSTFTNNLLDMLKELHGDKIGIHIAVLAAGNDSVNLNHTDVDTISFEEMHILSDSGLFFSNNYDIKQERYKIKECVIDAWNNKNNEPNSLSEKGYYISTYKIKNNDKNNSDHREYIVIYFDNPQDNNGLLGEQEESNLGRKMVPLSKVFLYISICEEDPYILPVLILREVLSYRNLILKMLEDDFDNEIMQKHAKSIQEEAVITHERSASHASTTDERGVLQVFGVGDVSELNVITHPINLQTKKLLDGTGREFNSYYSSELWLLFQNYVNGQIARLFNRNFSTNKDTFENEDVPKLYLGPNHVQMFDEFKKPMKRFGDLNICSDGRFSMLKKVVHLEVCVDENEEIYHRKMNGMNYFYNVEYMKCILFDIMFSSIKHATTDVALLPRIDNLLLYYDLTGASSVHSYVFVLRDNRDLVVLNNANMNRVGMERWTEVNNEIYRRIHDPLDYGDGHMSLFTIRRFIIGLYELDEHSKKANMDRICDTEYRYIDKTDAENIMKKYPVVYSKYKEIIKKEQLWFLTRLPIFMEENDNGLSNMDR